MHANVSVLAKQLPVVAGLGLLTGLLVLVAVVVVLVMVVVLAFIFVQFIGANVFDGWSPTPRTTRMVHVKHAHAHCTHKRRTCAQLNLFHQWCVYTQNSSHDAAALPLMGVN